MSVVNALAGVAVKELELSVSWYTLLFNRGPDERPMDELAEWMFEKGGWLQVFKDDKRAGSSSVTLVENDLDGRVAELKSKGVAVGDVTAGKFVKTAIVADPDGNQIVFAEATAVANRAASA